VGQSDMQRFRHQSDGYMEMQHADHGFLIDLDHSCSQSTRAQYTHRRIRRSSGRPKQNPTQHERRGVCSM